VVENRRLPGGKTAQRTVLYLGEINDRQQAACDIRIISARIATRAERKLYEEG